MHFNNGNGCSAPGASVAVGFDDVFHEVFGALSFKFTLATQEAKYVSEVFSIHVSFEVGSGIDLGRTKLALPEVNLRIVDAVIRVRVLCRG